MDAQAIMCIWRLHASKSGFQAASQTLHFLAKINAVNFSVIYSPGAFLINSNGDWHL